ncbi:MAG: amidohydrolase [Bacillota bacterium]
MKVQKRILFGGRPFVPGRGPGTAAIGISGDRIVGVGDLDDVRRLVGSGAEEIDMDGAFISPGFIDGHCHLLSYGAGLGAADLTGCRSIAEMKRIVAEAAGSAREGSWIVGRGWNQELFVERRFPRRSDLDEVAPDVPVFLRRVCGHAAVANSVALDRAGVTRDYPDSESGYLERDQSGEPDGVLHEAAAHEVARIIPEPGVDQKRNHLREAVRRCHAAGITSVQTNESADDLDELLDVYRQLRNDDTALRAYLDLPPALLDSLLERGLTTGSGDSWVRVGAIKLFADGSLGARSAALSGDYADDPGNRGTLVTAVGDLNLWAARAHSAGMQVAIHAIGDRALDVSLDAVELAVRKWPRPSPRHRMVHCQIMREEQFGRMADLRCVAAIQPKFVTTDQLCAEARVGEELAATSYSWRRMLDEGLICAGGSDAPVEPIEPLLGIWAAVCRTDMEGCPGGGWMPDQKVSPAEALMMFTRGSAYAEFAEKEKGIITRGALADLAVLARDPGEVPPEEIRDIEVLQTWVGGKVVFSAS